MPVVINDFEAVAGGGEGSSESGGQRPAQGPVSRAALDRLLATRRARRLRLWAH